jgi:hypothetical protein
MMDGRVKTLHPKIHGGLLGRRGVDEGVMAEHGIERIDLLKVNIEGGEYELLEHLIATGDIRKVRKLQVQFHDFVPDAIPRRARILQGLAQTHAQHWNFHFVWEEWGLKPELA